MQLNETLLSIILYIMAAKKFFHAREALLGKEQKMGSNDYALTRDLFNAIPEELFQKAGIRHCVANFEEMYDYGMSEASQQMVNEWRNTEAKDLEKFKINMTER